MAHDRGRVEVAELAQRFAVTTETIRRDLSELQSSRVVRRVHGGAIPWEVNRFEPRLSVRSDQHEAEKRRVASAAVEELPTSGAIVIDSGSTASMFAEVIPASCSLRVFTNSLPIAQTLSAHQRLDIIVIGGKVRKNTLAMVDAEAVAAMAPLMVDTLFISADAVSIGMGLTTPYREEAALKRAMISSARRVVALVDHHKFGHDQTVQFAKWSDIDLLITTHEADPETAAAIEALGTTVTLA